MFFPQCLAGTVRHGWFALIFFRINFFRKQFLPFKVFNYDMDMAHNEALALQDLASDEDEFSLESGKSTFSFLFCIVY